MIHTAKVESIHITARGRFVLVEMESIPKGNYLRRFHVPSETLQIGDRVKFDVHQLVKPQPEELAMKAAG